MSQLKFSLKIWIGGRTPGYTLAHDLKNVPCQKNQASYACSAQSCPATENKNKKKLIITGFLVKFYFIQIKILRTEIWFRSKLGLKKVWS